MKVVEFHVKQPKNMRYKTVGDWYTKFDEKENHEVVHIETVDLGEPQLNFLVLLHEFIEYTLCAAAGISQQSVDEYDFETQDDQDDGDEIGENDDAPYHFQHMVADGVERILASHMEIPWSEYNTKVDEAYERVSEEMTKKMKEAEQNQK